MPAEELSSATAINSSNNTSCQCRCVLIYISNIQHTERSVEESL